MPALGGFVWSHIWAGPTTLAVAVSCRDRACGAAARQLRTVDADALPDQLDDAFSIIPDQRLRVADVCARRIPS